MARRRKSGTARTVATPSATAAQPRVWVGSATGSALRSARRIRADTAEDAALMPKAAEIPTPAMTAPAVGARTIWATTQQG